MNIFIKVITISLFLTACTSLGPQFEEQRAPSDKALVYVYRPSKYANSMNAPDIQIDGKNVVGIPNGGYKPLLIEPGKHTFGVHEIMWADIDIDLKCTLEAGKKYYLRFEVFKSARDQSAAVGNLGILGSSVVMSLDGTQKSFSEDMVDTRPAPASSFTPTLFFVKEQYGSTEIKSTKLVK